MKKGFTLVELLAVIVILAVILAIAIPSISSVISNASKNALDSDAKMILKALEYQKMEDDTFNPSSINETNVKSELNLDDSNYETLTVKEINEIIYVTIVGKNKWDKLTVSGTKTITNVKNTVTTWSGGANAPVLASGMTPIKWDGSAWVDITASDTDWYNYTTTDKKWANARTADGSMWVWIPRYIYKINTASWHTSTTGGINIQFSKGIDDNWNKASIGNIILDESVDSSNNKWTNHPAFTFGDAELTGFWVAKFEASGTTTALDFKPNVTSLRNQTIGTFFTATRNMKTNNQYGWGITGNGIDTHMMKNTEWGAVAYLAQSTYGKNTEIWINNSSTYTTGCAGTSVSATQYAGCENTYDTTNGLQASTTGNIYGIYDMSGGVWEFTVDYINNGHVNLSTYGAPIISADSKYKEVYTVSLVDSETGNYALSTNKKGVAVYETSASSSGATSWNSDFSYMPRIDQPWFIRGGHRDQGTGAGLFTFNFNSGGAYGYIGFRSTLLVDQGL